MHLQSFTDQSLSVALKQVEHLMNSRPLTHVSVNPEAPRPLTTLHILLGRANPSITSEAFPLDYLSHKKRWRVAQATAVALLAHANF